MNKSDQRRESRLSRDKRKRKNKRRVSDTHPHAGMTPRCKEILARNRARLREEGKKEKATRASCLVSNTDKSLRRTMAI